MKKIHAKIISKRQEAEAIFSFELESADASPLPPFSAGSHIDVYLPGDITRQYSICSDPATPHRYQIAVLRDAASRGGSAAMHDLLHEGSIVQISAPRNHFPLIAPHEDGNALLFAGGIGVTPLLSMAESLHRSGARFSLHYCTRSIERTAFIPRIAGSGFAKQVHYHVLTGTAEQELDMPALLGPGQYSPHTHLYICGPAGFIDHVIATAHAFGWPDEQIHLEYFGAAPATQGSNTDFQVRIASTGATYAVPADQTITAVLAREGIEIPVSCEQGVCGTCITRVLEGIPDHRDLYLSEDEQHLNNQFTPCCSRALSKMLVLDL